ARGARRHGEDAARQGRRQPARGPEDHRVRLRPAMTLQARLTVTGRVQGVGYRDWVMGMAERLGLSGWVRNRVDGSVEAGVGGGGARAGRGAGAPPRGPGGGPRRCRRRGAARPRCPAGRLYAATDRLTGAPNTSSKVSASAASRSASVTGRPRSTNEVTPRSAMPQGTIPA